MPCFKLYTGNKLELLLDALFHIVRQPHDSPLTPEIIVVQNKGMEQWLSLQLSRKLCVWANCSFLFPNFFIESLFNQAIENLPERSPFDPQTMTWKIMAALPGLLDRKEFAPLKTYLADNRQLKLFQLSARIADAFDHYTLYRPFMVMQWDRGKDSHWQAILWRTLTKSMASLHRAQCKERLFELIATKSYRWPYPAQRISIFGISSLPPFYLEIIHALSTIIDVHVFLLNPCAQYWDDVLSRREIGRIAGKQGKRIAAFEELHWEKGNSLLTSMGAYGRDFLSRLHDLDGEEFALVEPPEPLSALSRVQSDILHLRQRGEHEDAPVAALEPGDDSIQVHSCHGPLREIEVLYDNLLRQFDKKPGLSPSDIVVMTPDIETYAPYIHAVFGAAENESLRIPYSVADRGLGADNPVIAAFLEIISIAQGRFTANEVLSLLEARPLREAFRITEADLGAVRSWVRDANIRWGLDESNRAEFDVPVFSENTWKSGIDRMLLGYAMSGNDRPPFKGILPFETIEAGQADLLACFLDFMGCLIDLRAALARPKPMNEWTSFFLTMADRLFPDTDENAAGVKTIRDAIDECAHSADTAGFTGDLDGEVFLGRLESILTKSISRSGFLQGAVTFCEMLPMRSIPFSVICLLGMDDAVFPRTPPHTGWDLMAESPQKGDRSLEKEDRYIFLEALLSARSVLYISYRGQDIRDNSSRQPSVVVSELLDYLDRGFFVPKASNSHIDSAPSAMPVSTMGNLPASGSIVFRHRLQAFSPNYFLPEARLFSYSEENHRAAEMNSHPDKNPVIFFPAPLEAPSEEWHSVDIVDLCAFFVHPAKFLLRKRLGIRLPDITESLQDREPFFIEGIDGYRIGLELVRRLLGKESRESCYETLKAESLLPHGNAGACAFNGLADEARVFVDRINSITETGELTPVRVEGRLDRFSIAGGIEQCGPQGLFMYRFAQVKPRDMLQFWIQTTILSAFGEPAQAQNNMLLARDGCWRLPRLDNAAAVLLLLLDAYWEGLRAPLHFFPKASWAYAENIVKKNKAPNEALHEARKIWIGDEYAQGEIRDPYFALCFSSSPESPLDDDFKKSSLDIYQPFIECVREP
jgi:exodeoxyribonuclease V gamma subunit